MLVTLEQARVHLRIDHDADDSWLNLMIPAISEAVLLWLKDADRAYETELDSSGLPVVIVDSNGDPIPRPVIRAAVLLEVAMQYRYREGEGAPQAPQHWGHGYTLGPGSTSLLTPLRRPTVA